jgi:hypothetical protein
MSEIDMHVRLFLVLTLSSLFCAPVMNAQDQPAAVPGNTPPVIKFQDGGANGRMESIFIPPKAGSPFSLTLVTEWTRAFGDGGTFTLTNQRRIVRDSRGRIYQERWLLVPKGGDVKSHMDIFQLTDPEQHTWYNCETATKTCELLTYRLSTSDNFQPAVGPSGPLPNGKGSHQHEDLGSSNIEGIETHGYRETLTINPGVLGNDKPMVTTREFWYSPELGINVSSTVDSPQSGKQVFSVKDLSAAEPEPSLFLVPDDYKVVDHRQQ